MRYILNFYLHSINKSYGPTPYKPNYLRLGSHSNSRTCPTHSPPPPTSSIIHTLSFESPLYASRHKPHLSNNPTIISASVTTSRCRKDVGENFGFSERGREGEVCVDGQTFGGDIIRMAGVDKIEMQEAGEKLWTVQKTPAMV